MMTTTQITNGHGRDVARNVSTTTTAAPELRFPEFHDDWQVKTLGECFDMLQNNTLSRSELNDKCGDYQNIHYGDVLIKYGSILDLSKEQLPFINDKSVAAKYEKSLLKDGDVIIADTAEDETVGKCTEVINVGDKKIISGLHTIPIRPIIDFAKCFIGLYFNSNVWHSQLLRIMQGTKVYSISKSQLKNIFVSIPTLPEQRKIALCLSSLDDLIKSVGDKIELLKQHKKGLMQKLFPKTHGTTYGRGHGRDAKFCVSTNPTIVPELRFPEFHDDWQVKRLGEIAEIVSEKENNSIENYVSTENLLPNYGGVVYDAKIPSTNSLTKYKFGDILLSNIRPYLKKIWQANVNGTASNDVVVFRVSNTFDDSFICFVLKNDRFIDYVMASAKGVKMPRGDKNMMLNYAVSFPTLSEQRKIASCLSSIDAAIEETENKLQMLEQHKKGLMQRMFVKM